MNWTTMKYEPTYLSSTHKKIALLIPKPLSSTNFVHTRINEYVIKLLCSTPMWTSEPVRVQSRRKRP